MPKTYDRQTFKLDGKLDLELSFEGKAITTSVYVKLDAYDQLLLSEGVCQSLGIVNYHLAVIPYARNKERKRAVSTEIPNCVTDPETVELQTVRVQLVQAVTVLPYQAVLVPVVCDQEIQSTAVFEPRSLSDEGVIVEPALIQPNEPVYICVANTTSYTQHLSKNLEMGLATEASIVEDERSFPIITIVSSETPEVAKDWRQGQIETLFCDKVTLSGQQQRNLIELLKKHHVGERGETDLVQFEINTGDAKLKKQRARRMPFSVRKEISRQLKKCNKLV